MRQNAVVTYKNGEKEFKLNFTQLRPSKALIMLMWLGKMLGGTAGSLLGSLEGVKSLKDLDLDDLDLDRVGTAISKVFANFDDQEVIEKINLLFESVDVEGQQLDIDHFMFDGNPLLILKVARKSLEINFSSFLGESSGIVDKFKKTLELLKNTQEEQA